MRKQSVCFLVAGAALGLALAACSSDSGGKDDGGTQDDGNTAQSIALKIGYQPSSHQVAHMVAMKKDFYKSGMKSVGLTEVTEIEFTAGGAEMDAMRSGNIDVAFVGVTPPLVALEKDPPFDGKIVAGVNMQGSTMVVQNDLTYSAPADLKGKKVGTLNPGSVQDIVLKKWLTDNSLTFSSATPDVTIKGYPGAADAVTAYGDKVFEAFFFHEPYPTQIEAANKGTVAIRSGAMWKNHPCCVVVVSGKLLKDRPDVVKALVKVVKDATDYSLQHKDEAATICAERIASTTLTADVVKKSIAEWDGLWDSNPNTIKDGTLAFANYLYTTGTLKKQYTADQLLDMSFYNAIK